MEIISSKVLGGFGTSDLRYHKSWTLVVRGTPYSLPCQVAVSIGGWSVFAVAWVFWSPVSSRIQPAGANSAVQVTSMPSRSMPSSLAASRRTNWSRCPSASLGRRLPTMLYRPAAALLQSARILSKPVPLAPPYRFTTTPFDPPEHAARELTSAAAPIIASHRDRRREDVLC